jgi:hypothetical protein
MIVYVKNWNKFQQYKDRCPPWIKLHRQLLDDPEWFALDSGDAKLLVMLWLLASEDETRKGTLPEPRKIAFRLRTSVEAIEALFQRLSHWVVVEDVQNRTELYETVQTGNEHVQTKKRLYPETETETETEGGADAPLAPAGPETQSPGLDLLAQPTVERGSGEGGKSQAPRGRPCPDDFRPAEKHYDAGAKYGFPRQTVDQICTRMRNWSHANSNRQIARKSDWSLAFFNFIDRYAADQGVVKKQPSRMDGIT